MNYAYLHNIYCTYLPFTLPPNCLPCPPPSANLLPVYMYTYPTIHCLLLTYHLYIPYPPPSAHLPTCIYLAYYPLPTTHLIRVLPPILHTYIHTYIPTYIHICIPIYLLHTYIPTYPPTYLHCYLPTYLPTSTLPA